jgi:hypothetical protein
VMTTPVLTVAHHHPIRFSRVVQTAPDAYVEAICKNDSATGDSLTGAVDSRYASCHPGRVSVRDARVTR